MPLLRRMKLLSNGMIMSTPDATRKWSRCSAGMNLGLTVASFSLRARARRATARAPRGAAPDAGRAREAHLGGQRRELGLVHELRLQQDHRAGDGERLCGKSSARTSNIGKFDGRLSNRAIAVGRWPAPP